MGQVAQGNFSSSRVKASAKSSRSFPSHVREDVPKGSILTFSERETSVHRVEAGRHGKRLSEVLLDAVKQGDLDHMIFHEMDHALANVRDERGRTPLMLAICYLNGWKLRAAVEMLLSCGADPELQDWNGMNAFLLCIIKKRSPEIIKLLSVQGRRL